LTSTATDVWKGRVEAAWRALIPPGHAFREEPPISLERYLGWLRTVAIIITGLALPFLTVQNLAASYLPLLFAAAYTSVIFRFVIPRRPHWLRGGFLVCTLETVTLGGAIALTGGIKSEFFVIYYPLTTLYALRFGRSQMLFAPVVAALTYGLVIFLTDAAVMPDWGVYGFRMYWLLMTGVVAGLLSERAESAEAALKGELRRTQALLQAAHAPAVGLTLDGVLSAVVTHSRRLAEADAAVVMLTDDQGNIVKVRGSPKGESTTSALVNLVSGAPNARATLMQAMDTNRWNELRDLLPSDPATSALRTVAVVPILGAESSLGMIVAARMSMSDEAAVHYEALSAFAERAALAIQNARLYESLQEKVEELQAMHEQIVRTERLAAIGEIAAKVAHELNNPLTSIQLYNSMLIEEPVEGAEQQRLAASMLEQVERAKRVVRDILDFSRPQESHPELTSLNATVEYGLRLIEHAAEATGVTITQDYAGDLPSVLVDTGQMAQIFTNLALNAIQAMPEGGKLIVRTGIQGEELYVSFTDTGTGISPTDQNRIFEPFFTTKAAGHGTGLGLPVVKGLVARHHGRITVDSAPGRGSTFTVWLPPAMQTEKEGLVARPQRR
jgi:signal transduction histidine kinase